MMVHMVSVLPKLASPEKRLYACAVDMLLLLLLAVILSFDQSEFLFFFLQLGYFVFFWSKGGGKTIGNRLMRIRVVTTQETAVSVKAAAIRYFGFLLSEIVLFIGFLGILRDKNRQGWHDKMAHTIVITG